MWKVRLLLLVEVIIIALLIRWRNALMHYWPWSPRLNKKCVPIFGLIVLSITYSNTHLRLFKYTLSLYRNSSKSLHPFSSNKTTNSLLIYNIDFIHHSSLIECIRNMHTMLIYYTLTIRTHVELTRYLHRPHVWPVHVHMYVLQNCLALVSRSPPQHEWIGQTFI